MYTALFAQLLFIVKVNRAEVEAFKQLPLGFGYFLISFGNGVGNIVNPSYDKPGTSHLDYAILFTIYLIWLFN
jgi:hypothetical protein